LEHLEEKEGSVRADSWFRTGDVLEGRFETVTFHKM